MGILKWATTHIPCQHPDFSLKGVHPDWEMHPSYIAGIEALDSYNHWVAEVVMPIAFQWIEEHKAEVYGNVSDDLKDDVGVVIAAAFQLIKELGSYKKGLVKVCGVRKGSCRRHVGSGKDQSGVDRDCERCAGFDEG